MKYGFLSLCKLLRFDAYEYSEVAFRIDFGRLPDTQIQWQWGALLQDLSTFISKGRWYLKKLLCSYRLYIMYNITGKADTTVQHIINEDST